MGYSASAALPEGRSSIGWIVAGLLAIFVCAAARADVRGEAEVTDGDSLRIAEQRVRLHGIDAPELRQICKNASNANYNCGEQAKAALRHAIAGSEVRCVQRDRDRYGRIVAVCVAGGVQLNRHMVREGWAVALPQYSRDYVADEETARRDRRGLWAGKFEMPEDWRRERGRR